MYQNDWKHVDSPKAGKWAALAADQGDESGANVERGKQAMKNTQTQIHRRRGQGAFAIEKKSHTLRKI